MSKLPKWFENRLKTVMSHNNYKNEWLTVDECYKEGIWTPCDLIIREYLNNGCGSSKGFLGLTPANCRKCMDYIRENKGYLISMDYVSQDGYNNCGFPLWKDWNF